MRTMTQGIKRTQAEVIEVLRGRGLRELRRWPDGTVNMGDDDEMTPVAPDGTCAGYETLEQLDAETR
jgi:hypothetical protein